MLDHWKLDFNSKDIHYYVILLSAPLLLTIYRYHGYPENLLLISNFGLPDEVAVRMHQFAYFFVLMFILPALYVRLVMKKNLRDFGFSIGDVKAGRNVLILIPLLVAPLIYIASKMPDVRSEYPLAKILLTDKTYLFVYELAYVIFYYIAWEFFFRGFLLFGLKDKYGATAAILIQTISSCLIHIGKPEGEIIGSIIVGVIFGVIAIRTRSFWYVFALHIAIGILTDIFIIYL